MYHETLRSHRKKHFCQISGFRRQFLTEPVLSKQIRLPPVRLRPQDQWLLWDQWLLLDRWLLLSPLLLWDQWLLWGPLLLWGRSLLWGLSLLLTDRWLLLDQ